MERQGKALKSLRKYGLGHWDLGFSVPWPGRSIRVQSLEVGPERKGLGVDGRQGQEVLIESEFPLEELSEPAWLHG